MTTYGKWPETGPGRKMGHILYLHLTPLSRVQITKLIKKRAQIFHDVCIRLRNPSMLDLKVDNFEKETIMLDNKIISH